jgi:hypothetical protein
MSKTNCRNCGGPLNIADPKCPFCGTKNVNLTDIDLASGEAANFIFRLPNYIRGAYGQEIYLSMLAVPELESLELTSDSSDIYGGWSHTPIARFTSSTELNCKLNLRTVQSSESNSLYSLTLS